MNENSIKAWNEIKYTTLADREQAVLKVIKEYGPINGRKIDVLVNGGHKRISNLLETGVIDLAYNGMDHQTGKITSYYIATGKKPTKAKVIRRSKPLDISGLYDRAFEAGVTEAVMCFIKDGDDVAKKVNEICEAMK